MSTDWLSITDLAFSRGNSSFDMKDRSKVRRGRHRWPAEILVIEIAEDVLDDELRYLRRKSIAERRSTLRSDD
ncbi:hypothetical protein Q1M62_06435 (plasmid) [Sinorhizobium meliloti]|nr:hypothetical protein Q1M62_06435 [Sinorhizobium meliloti]